MNEPADERELGMNNRYGDAVLTVHRGMRPASFTIRSREFLSSVGLSSDDVAMNSSLRPTRHRDRPSADPVDYVVRRLSSLPLVGGAFLALLSAALLESAGVRSPAAIAAGVVVFVASALVTEVILGDRIRHHLRGPR